MKAITALLIIMAMSFNANAEVDMPQAEYNEWVTMKYYDNYIAYHELPKDSVAKHVTINFNTAACDTPYISVTLRDVPIIMQSDITRVVIMQSNVARVLEKPDGMEVVYAIDDIHSWTAAGNDLMLVNGVIADGTSGIGIASPADDAFISQIKDGDVLDITIGTDDITDVIHASLDGVSNAIDIAHSHCNIASMPATAAGFSTLEE